VVSYLLDQGYPATMSLVPRLAPGEQFRPASVAWRARSEFQSILARHQRIAAASSPTAHLPTRQASWTGEVG
jgi:hypothetical protein